MKFLHALFAGAAGLALASGVALAQPPAGANGRTPPTPEQRAARFAKADANKDGSLSKAEFALALPERQRERVDVIWPVADANADGKLSKDEFLAMRGRGQGGGRSGQ